MICKHTLFGAGRQMLRHPALDSALVAPCVEGIDQSIGAALGKVGLVEAETEQMTAIVWPLQKSLEVFPRRFPGHCCVLGEHDALLDRYQGAGTDVLSHRCSVVGCAQKRMGAIRHLPGQRSHPGTERRKHPRRRMIRWVAVVGGDMHLLEVGPHRLQ